MRKNDSAGGVIECRINGVPAGIGDPVFGKLDAAFAQALMSIGAVKAVEIGDGAKVSTMRGSENNDGFHMENGRIVKIGSFPHIRLTCSIFSSSITRGTTRIPATLSPFFTGKFPWRDAITICPNPFTAFSFSLSTLSSPSVSAVSSIFPSFGFDAFRNLP